MEVPEPVALFARVRFAVMALMNDILLTVGEIKKKVLDLAREGRTISEIGLILQKDQIYNFEKQTGLTYAKFLEQNDLHPAREIDHLRDRIRTLEAHLALHPRDLHNRRARQRLQNVVLKFQRYERRGSR